MNMCILEPNFILQISQPHKIAQNLQMDLSFQKKNGLNVCFLVAEIINKQSNMKIIQLLWDTLYILKHSAEYSKTLGVDQFHGLGLGLEAETQIISVSDSVSILRL